MFRLTIAIIKAVLKAPFRGIGVIFRQSFNAGQEGIKLLISSSKCVIRSCLIGFNIFILIPYHIATATQLLFAAGAADLNEPMDGLVTAFANIRGNWNHLLINIVEAIRAGTRLIISTKELFAGTIMVLPLTLTTVANKKIAFALLKVILLPAKVSPVLFVIDIGFTLWAGWTACRHLKDIFIEELHNHPAANPLILNDAENAVNLPPQAENEAYVESLGIPFAVNNHAQEEYLKEKKQPAMLLLYNSSRDHDVDNKGDVGNGEVLGNLVRRTHIRQ